jgi:ubiquinone biosynthesis protein COQ4
MKRVLLSMLGMVKWLWLEARAGYAALRLLRDPNRLDEVFALDRATPGRVRRMLVEVVSRHERGRRALDERPRMAVDLEMLRALPEGTFGRAVAQFYDRNGLTPAAIPSVEAVDEASYVTAHLYETHDVWHVATGFGSDVAEELGLQAVYAAQLPGRLAPILIAGGLVQAALWVQDDFAPRLAAVARGYRMGRRCEPLFGVRWDEMWGVSLDTVRLRLGLVDGLEASALEPAHDTRAQTQEAHLRRALPAENGP